MQELPRNKIKEYILSRFLACLKERKNGKKHERTNERTDGRTNENTLSRLLDASCFVVCRSTVQKYLVIVVVKV